MHVSVVAMWAMWRDLNFNRVVFFFLGRTAWVRIPMRPTVAYLYVIHGVVGLIYLKEVPKD